MEAKSHHTEIRPVRSRLPHRKWVSLHQRNDVHFDSRCSKVVCEQPCEHGEQTPICCAVDFTFESSPVICRGFLQGRISFLRGPPLDKAQGIGCEYSHLEAMVYSHGRAGSKTGSCSFSIVLPCSALVWDNALRLRPWHCTACRSVTDE